MFYMGPEMSKGSSPDAGKQLPPAVGQEHGPKVAELDPRSSLADAPPLPPIPPGAIPAGADGPSGAAAKQSISPTPQAVTGAEVSNGGSGESGIVSGRADFFSKVGPEFDLKEWIAMSGLKDKTTAAQEAIFREDLNKIRRVGVWKDPDHSGSSDAPLATRLLRAVPLGFCRGAMGASWIGTVGAIAAFAVVAPVGLVVYAPPIVALNWAFQKTAGWLYSQKFESVFAELKREAGQAGSLQAGIAWVGVMHEFLDKQNPLYILPNQTKLGNFQDSTSLEAVKRQLRQAAQYAADKLDKTSGAAGPYFKDQFFNDMLAQNEESLNAFAKRCMGFPNKSAEYTNPITLFKKFWYGK
jgi:hypothetical protein